MLQRSVEPATSKQPFVSTDTFLAVPTYVGFLGFILASLYEFSDLAVPGYMSCFIVFTGPNVSASLVVSILRSEDVGARAMARKDTNVHLLLLSKSEAKVINYFRLGVQMSASMGDSIDDLIEIACVDRFRFAQKQLAVARANLGRAKPSYRDALARAYYSMYHAARAVVFLVEKGDDHQEHSELPRHLPSDFPNRVQWENGLKNARLERNKADYDPYPKSDRAFMASAKGVTSAAIEFLKLAKGYLVKKGCTL
jgi:uncharacterized protein (UPF0332 family)